jgi:hypothetical protein
MTCGYQKENVAKKYAGMLRDPVVLRNVRVIENPTFGGLAYLGYSIECTVLYCTVLRPQSETF